MVKYDLTSIIIGIVLFVIVIKIFRKKSYKQQGMKEADDDSKSECVIRDGIIICPNNTQYSPYYYPWWFYRYPYHRTYHKFPTRYRHRYGRHYKG